MLNFKYGINKVELVTKRYIYMAENLLLNG
jgi:hypothetical protein